MRGCVVYTLLSVLQKFGRGTCLDSSIPRFHFLLSESGDPRIHSNLVPGISGCARVDPATVEPCSIPESSNSLVGIRESENPLPTGARRFRMCAAGSLELKNPVLSKLILK